MLFQRNPICLPVPPQAPAWTHTFILVDRQGSFTLGQSKLTLTLESQKQAVHHAETPSWPWRGRAARAPFIYTRPLPVGACSSRSHPAALLSPGEETLAWPAHKNFLFFSMGRMCGTPAAPRSLVEVLKNATCRAFICHPFPDASLNWSQSTHRWVPFARKHFPTFLKLR